MMRARPSLAVAGVLIGIYVGVFLFLGTRLPVPSGQMYPPRTIGADVPMPDRANCGIRMPVTTRHDDQPDNNPNETVARDLFRFGMQNAPAQQSPSVRMHASSPRKRGSDRTTPSVSPAREQRRTPHGRWRLIGIVDSGGVLVSVWTNGAQTVWRSVGEAVSPGTVCIALYPQMATVRLPDGTIRVVRIGEWMPE